MKESYYLHEIEQLTEKNITLFTNRNSVPLGYFSHSIKQLVDKQTPKEDIIGFYKKGKRNKKPIYYSLYTLSTNIKIIQYTIMPLGYQRLSKHETNQGILPDAFWFHKGMHLPIKDIRKGSLSDKLDIYEGKNTFIKTGLFTEKMIRDMKISFDETTIVGYITTPYENFPLYKPNSSYDHIKVLYDYQEIYAHLCPNDCFTKEEITRYNLTSIAENEPPGFIYHWIGYTDMNEVISGMTFYYNRKNEEKYRLRFLLDPDFDTRRWEEEK